MISGRPRSVASDAAPASVVAAALSSSGLATVGSPPCAPVVPALRMGRRLGAELPANRCNAVLLHGAAPHLGLPPLPADCARVGRASAGQKMVSGAPAVLMFLWRGWVAAATAPSDGLSPKPLLCPFPFRFNRLSCACPSPGRLHRRQSTSASEFSSSHTHISAGSSGLVSPMSLVSSNLSSLTDRAASTPSRDGLPARRAPSFESDGPRGLVLQRRMPSVVLLLSDLIIRFFDGRL